MRVGPRRILAAVIVGLLALATLFAMVAVTTAGSWRGIRYVESAPEVRSVPVAAGQALTLDVTSGGGVTVTDGPPGQAAITATRRSFGWWPTASRVSWTQTQAADGPEVRVGLAPAPWAAIGFAPDVVVQVALPPDASLRLTEDNGPVTLGGSHPQARLAVTNGAIQVRGFHGVLAAQDLNGALTVADSTVPGGLELTSTNGRIEVRNTEVRGALSASTVNGAIAVTGARLTGAFDLHSVNGSISYAGAGGTGGRAATVNGAVTLLLDRPAAGGHYAVSTPHGLQMWPDGSGSELGGITLESTNGAVQIIGGGSGS